MHGCCNLISVLIFLVNELEKLHHKHGIRPDVFGDSEGEHEIEILTGEITQVKFILSMYLQIKTYWPIILVHV